MAQTIKDLQEWMARYPDYQDQIKILRQTLGMTQEQLAKLVDRTPRSIRTIENGEAYPRITTLQKIADALNADLIISLIPKTGIEVLNESSKQVVKLKNIDIDEDPDFEMPSGSIPGNDIQIGETD